MTDESALTKATARASRAQRLIEDDLLAEAFTSLEAAYIAAWRATKIDDTPAREKLFLAINVVGKVRDHLEKVVSDGKIAQAELKALAETAERKKRFGII